MTLDCTGIGAHKFKQLQRKADMTLFRLMIQSTRPWQAEIAPQASSCCREHWRGGAPQSRSYDSDLTPLFDPQRTIWKETYTKIVSGLQLVPSNHYIRLHSNHYNYSLAHPSLCEKFGATALGSWRTMCYAQAMLTITIIRTVALSWSIVASNPTYGHCNH